MEEKTTSPFVKLLAVTQPANDLSLSFGNAEGLIEFAGRLCYDSTRKMGDDENWIEKRIRQGHESILEHVSASFLIICSRAVSHELVRHRLASFCLAGDTVIKGARSSNRGHRLFTIKSLYERTLTHHGRSRLKLIRLKSYDEENKVFDKSEIKNIFYTGKQEVWKIKLENGQEIKATSQHRFLSENGWRTLEEIIEEKPKLGVNGTFCKNLDLLPLRDKNWLYDMYNIRNYTQKEIADFLGCAEITVRSWVRKHKIQKDTGGLHGHAPKTGYHQKSGRPKITDEQKEKISQKLRGPNHYRWKGGVTDESLLLRKEVTPEIRKAVYERDGYQCRLCHSVGGKLTLHHNIPIYSLILMQDKQFAKQLASDPDYLTTLCWKCHCKVNNHESEYSGFFGTDVIPYHSRSKGCYRVIKWVSIVSAENCGIEDTYDMEMKGPHHNFVANGFVVHNSQRSQRYVSESRVNFLCPEDIAMDKIPDKQALFNKAMQSSWDNYRNLLKMGVSKESARYVLPNACATELIMTMNFRELRHFIEMRMDPKAMTEMRNIAGQVFKICCSLSPKVFKNIVIVNMEDMQE